MSRVPGQSVADTNDRLVWSAFRTFRKHGISNTKVSDICADARVSRKTLYEYYENKYDLFHAVMCMEAKFYREALEKIDLETDPEEIIRSVFYIVFDGFGSGFGFLMSEISVNPSIKIPEEAREAARICLDRVEHAIAAGSSTGQFRKNLDSQCYLATMNIMINGFYSSSGAVEQMFSLNLKDDFSLRFWREHLASVLISSLH